MRNTTLIPLQSTFSHFFRINVVMIVYQPVYDSMRRRIFLQLHIVNN